MHRDERPSRGRYREASRRNRRVLPARARRGRALPTLGLAEPARGDLRHLQGTRGACRRRGRVPARAWLGRRREAPARALRPEMMGSVQDLEKIAAVTLDHYNRHAEDFREGTRDHDVSQNTEALLQAIAGEPPFAVLDFGCWADPDPTALPCPLYRSAVLQAHASPSSTVAS